jgi:outer membrane protein OmpA-like peptidoglycan-associated protein
LRRLLAAGGTAETEALPEGLTRITIDRPDGSRVVTWRDASGELVRRVRVLADGREIVLFDEGDGEAETVRVSELPPLRRDEQRTVYISDSTAEELGLALRARPIAELDRRFSLRQVRETDELRWLMPAISLDALTFETGSAELGLDQIAALDALGREIATLVAEDPDEVFLVEGHTDAIGPAIYNLALSDRRAETVATLIASHYGVPPENLITQGFGKQDLKVPTLGPSRENRRVEVRRITPLLRQAGAE